MIPSILLVGAGGDATVVVVQPGPDDLCLPPFLYLYPLGQ